MESPLIAIVGDVSAARQAELELANTAEAERAAVALGKELARRGARLLVYGGPFLEAHVVKGFAEGKPAQDQSILMWYARGDETERAFPEETTHPKLFQRRVEAGDWEIAFYRSIASADGVILIGGGNTTKIVGQIAIGSRKAILALSEYGGAALKVWGTLSAGVDLPTRDEITLMAVGMAGNPVEGWVEALFAQHRRRKLLEGTPRPILSVLSALLFIVALAVVAVGWGGNSLAVWMLFLVPLLAGGAGATIRPMVDRQQGTQPITQAVLATVVLGLVAGGIAGVLFVTAQLTGNPTLADANQLAGYAQRSMPYALGIGFIAGLTCDVLFGKLLKLDVLRTSGTAVTGQRS